MKPGRAFSLLTGVALLGAVAKFNEMTPDAQASLLGASAETARTAAQSLLSNAIATYNVMTSTTETTPDTAAQPPAARVPEAARAEESKAAESAPARRVAARTQDAEPPSGNPLWALPLKQLSMTRDRPIFSPSRRPPPPTTALVAPVAVRQQVKTSEPERLTVSLLGTIIGANDQIGVFLDSATQNVIRLRVGEDHQGWTLRVIKAREATLMKSGEQAVVLEMPTPGDAPSMGMAGAMPSMPGVVQPGGLPGFPGAIVNGAIPNPAAQAAAAAQQRQQQQQRRQR